MTCGERNREIIALYESGMPKAEIQERMGVTVYSLNKIIDAYAKKGDAIFIDTGNLRRSITYEVIKNGDN